MLGRCRVPGDHGGCSRGALGAAAMTAAVPPEACIIAARRSAFLGLQRRGAINFRREAFRKESKINKVSRRAGPAARTDAGCDVATENSRPCYLRLRRRPGEVPNVGRSDPVFDG